MRTFPLENYMNPSENINIIYVKRDLGCQLHIHEFVELIFIVSGEGEHTIDGVCYKAEPGDLLFVNYGQTHSFQAKGEGFQYYNLLYLPQFFSEELLNSENIYDIFEISLFREFMDTRKGRGSAGNQIIHFRGKEFKEAKRMVEEMYREFTEKEVGYRSVLNGFSRVFFSRMLRKLTNAAENKVSGDARRYLNQVTAECLEYIDSRCFEKITLKEIAEHTFYNPAYFSRIFKENCGVSLSEYIKEKRMEEAACLLKETNLSNDEIMDKVGYTDKKQFYKNFREIYGVTPAQFRKK